MGLGLACSLSLPAPLRGRPWSSREGIPFRHWAGFFTSLCLNFFIYKMGTV